MITLRFVLLPFASCLLPLALPACQEQPPQTGHRIIAEAVRALLDKAYAGADYPAYRNELRKLEAVITREQQHVPVRLRPKVEEMLGLLRTAGDILRWQAGRTDNTRTATNDPVVHGWIRQYPFLGAAVGAHTPGVFDVQTAVTLLWDKTNAVLPEFQIKRGS
jgi:hypothetical protein